MAKQLRQHWKLTTAAALAAIITAVTIGHLTRDTSAAGDTTPPDEQTLTTQEQLQLSSDLGELARLRRRLGLTTKDLAAMGCSQATSEQVLGALWNWTRQNETALRSSREAMAQARGNLESILRQVQIGPANTSHQTLAQARTQVTNATASERQLVDAAAAVVDSLLSHEARSTRQAIVANENWPRRYRYVNSVTAETAAALRQQLRAGEDLAAAEATVLTLTQRQAMQAAEANISQLGNGVRAAELAVIPVLEDQTP